MTEKKILTPPPTALDRSTPIMTTVAAVPWDAELLKGRECRTCACYFEQVNPENAKLVQGFCRRLPADMASVRGLEPRKDLNGAVVMRDGKPVMQPAEVIGYLFKTTKPEGTCFDGWRALGTLPGERSIDATIRQFGDRLQPMMERIPAEFRPFLAALFGLAVTDTIAEAITTREQ